MTFIKGKRPGLKEVLKYKNFYIMLLPVIAYYFIFSYLPMLGIRTAFYDYNIFKGYSGSEFVGFKWFMTIFQSSEFGRALRNTLIISFMMLVINFPAPIILALLLNECKNYSYKRVIQTVSYLPHFMSWAIVSGLIVTMLSPSVGVVNQVIKILGGQPIYFMIEPQYTRWILVFSNIWKDVGWGAILFLAGISGISQELYESAKIDGAGKLKQTMHITLPGISNIVIMTLIFSVSAIFDVGFQQAYNLVIPPTYETGLVISTYVFNTGIRQMQYGYTTAVGLAQSVAALIMLLLANAVAKKFNKDAAVL